MEKDDKQKEWLKSLLRLSNEELETLSKSEIDLAKSNLINLINSNLDVLIIKGAAGTGKTKTIEILNEIKDTYKINYKIFTPTFAAATNIRSRNLGEVQTIQWFFNKNLNEQKQLLNSIDILIVDEASMLTSGYLQDLINLRKVFKRNFKYIFMGDSAQIRPYDGIKESQEYESYALLESSFKHLKCTTFILETPWRFISEPKVSIDFLSFLYFLRNKDYIDELPQYLPRCPEVDYVREKNDFLNLLHVTPSVLDYVIDLIDNGFNDKEVHKALEVQYPSIIHDIPYEQFQQTVQILKDKNSRTAEIGNIYKNLINENKNNTTLIVRGNEQANELTHALRKSLFEEKIRKKINKNDLLRINSTGSDVFFKGDIVRIITEPVKTDLRESKVNNIVLSSIPMSEELNSYFDSIYSITVERVMIGQSENKKIETENILVNTAGLNKLNNEEYRKWTNSIREEIQDIVNEVLNPKKLDSYPQQLLKYKNLTLDDLDKFKEIDNRFKQRSKFAGSSNVIPTAYKYGYDGIVRLEMWEEMEKLVGRRKYSMGEMISPTLQPKIFKELEDFLNSNNDQKLDSDQNLIEKINVINKLSSVDIVYGYCMTGFRSQGGEWENVIIQDSDIWNDPRYLYTAMSRAKDKVFFSNYTLKD